MKLQLLNVNDVVESQMCCGCGACAYAVSVEIAIAVTHT